MSVCAYACLSVHVTECEGAYKCVYSVYVYVHARACVSVLERES